MHLNREGIIKTNIFVFQEFGIKFLTACIISKEFICRISDCIVANLETHNSHLEASFYVELRNATDLAIELATK